MPDFFTTISEWIIQLAETIPVFWFAVIGPFLEEVIAVIPSPLVMTTVGTLAAARGLGWIEVAALVALGTTTKTIASCILWYAARRLSTETVERYGSRVGISPKEMKNFRSHLRGTSHDDLLLFALRATPIIPTGAVSIAAGTLGIHLRGFALATWAGVMIQHSFYAAVGYTGSRNLERIMEFFEKYSFVGYGVLLAFGIAGGWYAWKRFFKD